SYDIISGAGPTGYLTRRKAEVGYSHRVFTFGGYYLPCYRRARAYAGLRLRPVDHRRAAGAAESLRGRAEDRPAYAQPSADRQSIVQRDRYQHRQTRRGVRAGFGRAHAYRAD